MAERSRGPGRPAERLVEGARLEPIRTVERELTCPDGTKLVVQVPVYPPFRLEQGSEKRPPSQSKAPRRKKAQRRQTG